MTTGIYKILDEEWRGLERGSDEWCHDQVKALTNAILDDSVDIKGIRALIMEMAHNNLDEAVSVSARLIEHLFKVKYYQNQDSLLIKDWIKEIFYFQDSLLVLFRKGKNI